VNKDFTVDFTIEDAMTWLRDAQYLFPLHYRELARDQESIPMDLDFDRYKTAEQNGQLLIVAARVEKKIIGYYICALLSHLHYKSSGLMATTDMYFVHPDFRVGGTGIKLIVFVETILRSMGVTKMYVSTKLHSDHSALFEALGFRATDKVFTKLLAGA
jgi:N-acetylglutamate synthase-like GNAT family acetyltransferase